MFATPSGRRRSRSVVVAGAGLSAMAAATGAARATLIYGVEAAAYDQPQIHFLLTLPGSSDPLLYDDGQGDTGYNVQAYLDTGASGIVLSQETAQAFGLDPITYNGQQVNYNDTGVAGGQGFAVSQQLNMRLAAFDGFAHDANYGGPEPDLPAYTQSVAGVQRMQITTTPADDLLGPLDIAGTPVLQGKVMVMDPRQENLLLTSQNLDQGDELHTYVYAPGTPFNASTIDSDPGIPATNHTVRLSNANFGRFTETDPPGAPSPSISANPMIGPDPVAKLAGQTGDATPPVVIQLGTKLSSGSFLLDTGAQASFISSAEAANLGVHYQAGTQGTDDPILVDAHGNVLPNQFQIPIGGIGGTVTAAGFYLDSLSLPTVEGDAVTFANAPVLVTDVTVTDPVTGQSLTLDGDIGINWFVPSYSISGEGGSIAQFDWFVYDQAAATLGLQYPVDPDLQTVPAGPAFHFVANGSGGVMARSVLGLKLAPGASVVVDAALNHANRQLLVIGGEGLSLGGLPGAWTSRLDLGNNDLDLPGQNLAVVTNMVAQGFAGGTWNGSAGIVSSTAAADHRHLTALGVIANLAADGTTALYTSFDGQAVTAGDILVKFTYYGDTNLDGVVNAADYTRIDAGFVLQMSGWGNGDFNYDGVINGSDYALMDNAFNQQAANLSSAGVFAGSAARVAAVPEPAGLALLAVAGAASLGRRRRLVTPSWPAGATGPLGAPGRL